MWSSACVNWTKKKKYHFHGQWYRTLYRRFNANQKRISDESDREFSIDRSSSFSRLFSSRTNQMHFVIWLIMVILVAFFFQRIFKYLVSKNLSNFITQKIQCDCLFRQSNQQCVRARYLTFTHYQMSNRTKCTKESSFRYSSAHTQTQRRIETQRREIRVFKWLSSRVLITICKHTSSSFITLSLVAKSKFIKSFSLCGWRLIAHVYWMRLIIMNFGGVTLLRHVWFMRVTYVTSYVPRQYQNKCHVQIRIALHFVATLINQRNDILSIRNSYQFALHAVCALFIMCVLVIGVSIYRAQQCCGCCVELMRWDGMMGCADSRQLCNSINRNCDTIYICADRAWNVNVTRS